MRRLLALAALALSGCSLVGGGEAEIRALVTLPAEAAGHDVTVGVDGRPLPLSPSPTTAGPAFVAEPRAIGTGAVAVTCAVSDGTATGTARLTLDAADGWAYFVQCMAQPADPTDGCFGCSTAVSVALDPALGLPADARLWLFWTGEPESGTVLY